MSALVKRFKTASGRIEETKYNKWVAKCVEKGISPNEDILKHIDKVLNENERGNQTETKHVSGQQIQGNGLTARKETTKSNREFEIDLEL